MSSTTLKLIMLRFNLQLTRRSRKLQRHREMGEHIGSIKFSGNIFITDSGRVLRRR